MIDQEALQRLQQWGGPKLVLEMVRLYLDNTPERIGQLQRGFDHGDLKAVERAAHSLKSSSANVGALELSRLAERMESLAEAGSVADARALHLELVSAHDDACRELEQYLEGARS